MGSDAHGWLRQLDRDVLGYERLLCRFEQVDRDRVLPGSGRDHLDQRASTAGSEGDN
jgi:hypothetical protein